MDHHPSSNPLSHINDFELRDFIDDPNFDQFVDLIRGGQNDAEFGGGDLMADPALMDHSQFVPNNFGEFSCASPDMLMSAHDLVVKTMPSFEEESMRFTHDDYNDAEDSSGTSGTVTNGDAASKTKTDRSRTLISERRRRGRMKEKLYALRSLVPNITKMDKASIVGDAVLYMQELQTQAKKLKSEIAGLEASLIVSERYQKSIDETKTIHIKYGTHLPVSKSILQMDVNQVEERGFYVKLVCNRGRGVASALYKFLESLSNFNISNSNLTCSSDRFLLTFTLNEQQGMSVEQSLNLPNLKLWITGALLNQGFEFL